MGPDAGEVTELVVEEFSSGRGTENDFGELLVIEMFIGKVRYRLDSASHLEVKVERASENVSAIWTRASL